MPGGGPDSSVDREVCVPKIDCGRTIILGEAKREVTCLFYTPEEVMNGYCQSDSDCTEYKDFYEDPKMRNLGGGLGINVE